MNRSFVKKYRNEYELKKTIDPITGKEISSVIYNGPRFAPVNEAKETKNCKITAAIASCACIIMYIISGYLDTSGGRSVLTMLPFAAAVLPLGFLCMSVFNMFMYKPPLTRMENDKSYGRAKQCSGALAVLAALAALGSCVLMAIGSEKIAQDMMFAALCAGIAVLALVSRNSIKRIQVEMIIIEDTTDEN